MIFNRGRIGLGILCIWTGLLTAQRVELKSPDQFLPYHLGSRFTPHHLLVDYFHYIDAQTDKVQVIQYGQTYEYRPLIVAIISSPANMKRLETIRQNNLKRTGMMDGKVTDDSIAIVYISCSIHGNEAAGSESSMEVLYDLAKGGDPYDSWLKHAVVILDPSLNPDGYERFTQYSNSLSASPNDPRPEVREHNEPWPGGRFNHYDTDLNRDWAWQTQQETRARIAFYLQWMPHVHADLHEMEADASYYFAPAAQPYHPYLTAWQVECQKIIGQNHAHHFDEKGWRYYTKERFDLFYPGYGDTYPIFAGSIGMTYEQGGAAYADRAILLDNGDTLTLSDRIAHHREATLSTIEVAAQNAERLDREFEAFYQSSRTSPPGHVKSYVIHGQNNPGKIEDLLALLRLNKIQFGQAKENRIGLKGFRFSSGQQDQFDVQEGDLVIPVAQPRSVLLQVLFEPEAKLSDSLTYDITAWSLPMAYGLDAFSTDEAVDYTTWQNQASSRMMESVHPVAYAVEWGSVPSAQLLIRMIKGGLVARYALEAFTVNGKEFAPGTILLMRSDNQHHPQFDVLIKDLAAGSVVPVTPISTGFVESGKDLGSNSYPLIRRPEVVAISGDEMNPTSLGEAWHYFEEELDYPIHFVNLHELDRANLEAYNIMLWTEGYFDLKDNMLEKILTWVRKGGHLVVIGSSVDIVSGKKGFSIKRNEEPKPDSLAESESLPQPKSYSSGAREYITGDIQGTVFKTQKDPSSPLSFGLGETYWTLKTRYSSYAWLKDGQNAIYLDEHPEYFGFAGAKALHKIGKTLIAGEEAFGGGSIIYLVDNPLFRNFWNNGKVLFANALFF